MLEGRDVCTDIETLPLWGRGGEGRGWPGRTNGPANEMQLNSRHNSIKKGEGITVKGTKHIPRIRRHAIYSVS
jgi:hypothetical protein